MHWLLSEILFEAGDDGDDDGLEDPESESDEPEVMTANDDSIQRLKDLHFLASTQIKSRKRKLRQQGQETVEKVGGLDSSVLEALKILEEDNSVEQYDPK